MNRSEIDAFEKHGINEYYREYAKYTFYQGEDDGSIKIEIVIREMWNGRFTYAMSHAVHTPIQAGPYHSSINTTETADAALRKALDDIYSFYEAARQKGHVPTIDWFVPVKSYP